MAASIAMAVVGAMLLMVMMVIVVVGAVEEVSGFSAVQHTVNANMAAERRFDEMEVGAGDMGIMSGYARGQTEGFMSLMHRVATRLGRKLTDLRKSDVLLWLRPDGKTQVAVEYLQRVDGSVEPQKIHTRLDATAPSMEDMTNSSSRRW
mmetsp:Transcript_124453/g.311197  ORF Transcript_124453/g.311197 Transcript_124453/m.311197 type:complete len:149 (+) Transcript_124453:59-505(+)